MYRSELINQRAMNIIVGMADMQVMDDPKVTLITYSLGSCIGVTLYDPSARVGGLLHFMLPDSQIDVQKAKKNPWMFADTGLPLFFSEACKLGVEKGRMQVKTAGGSQMMDESGFFNIGARNHMALRTLLRMQEISVDGEDIGGPLNRTLSIDLSSGKVWVKISGDGIREL
jgi:chemotaxis protein CheD